MNDEKTDQEITSAHNWSLIQESLDHLTQGITVFNRDLKLVLFNSKFGRVLDFPLSMVKIGTDFEEFIRFNAIRGEYGPGDIEAQVRERLETARLFLPHSFERKRPNGTVIEICGNPLPGGGFVTIYTDVTERKRIEAKLRELASIDELTGLYNRRQFFSLAEHEVKRAMRHKHPMTIIMADVDNFKNINDKYGHAVGDIVLRKISEVCRNSIRNVDVIGRYGGEEFIILLPETGEENSLLVAERIIRNVASTPVELGSETLVLTISLGLAACTGEEVDLPRLIDRADAALYLSKQNGRNRVTVAPEY